MVGHIFGYFICPRPFCATLFFCFFHSNYPAASAQCGVPPCVSGIPEEIAAEDEAEHEDEEADAQDDDVDIQRQVEDLLRRHPGRPCDNKDAWMA